MPAPSSTSSRNPCIDALKGAACLAIVCHHLSVYGPLAQSAAALAPDASAWLYGYGRMAVQIFLVLGGYLAAASLAPDGVARFASAGEQIARRFMRLTVPYLAALAMSVAVAALVRPWLDDASVPAAPSLFQLLANALMLQDVLGVPALSAGIWYVAIDMQLFALVTVGLSLARAAGRGNASAVRRLGSAGVVSLCCASLVWFNRNPEWDVWAVYFFGSYGLGMMAFWATRRSASSARWTLAVLALGAAALLLDFRPRMALALATALALMALALYGSKVQPLFASRAAAPLVWVGQRSYSVFLIHFPVCLAVNAVFDAWWPQDEPMHAVGLVTALAMSLWAGRWLYERVEKRRASLSNALQWQMRFAGAGVLAMLAQAAVL